MDSPGFYLVQALTGCAGAASLFFVAVGLQVVFGVTRIVNFAHGSFYMLGAYLGLTCVALAPAGAVGFWGSVVTAALAVGLIGAAVERVLLRRLYAAPELFQLLATFGLVLVIQDLALWIWGPEDRVGPRAPGLRGSLAILDARLPLYDLVLVGASPLVLMVLWLLFQRTRWGTLIRAATHDRLMVGALGVDTRPLFTGALFLGSALAGLGGALQLPKGGANLLMDLDIIAPAFVVVVVGGLGSLGGAFLASLLIGQLNAFAVLLLPQLSLVLMFLVMAVVLVWRPWGLLGRPESLADPAAARPLQGLGPSLPGAALALLAAGLITLPVMVGDYGLVLAIEMLLFALFAASLHFLMGPGGIVSFGHAAYFAAGAYAMALATVGTNLPLLVTLPMACLAAGLIAGLFGWFCVRLAGVYRAMLTLACAQILWSVLQQWTIVTGGDDGILNVWPDAWAQPRVVFYYLVLGCAGLGFAALRQAARSPMGWCLRAARDAPERALASGIPVRRVQWAAFTLAGATAGLAGALYALAKGSVFPDEAAIGRSVDALLMVLLGGVDSLDGPLLGAFAFTGLHDLFARLPIWRLLTGLAIIGICLALPGGLTGPLARWQHAATGQRPR